MYQALYRKYRPQTFDDMVGQPAVKQTLKTQVLNGRVGHAYLFTGSRGTGKTSSARILAKAVNCQDPQGGNPCNRCPACQAIDDGSCMDVLEIDAATNRGIDSVRDLRETAIYTPAQVKMRVYIIDEAHMITQDAFNALLKIIEEPPSHLLFILATTELHKVPATILSRCQRFSFHRISQEDIAARLQYVAYQENIDLDDAASRVLARLADGALRDGLSLLDQCASATVGELTAERVYTCLGIAGVMECCNLMTCIAEQDTGKALALFNRLYAEGRDIGAMLDELISLTRDLMVLKAAPKEGIAMLSGAAPEPNTVTLAGRFSDGELVRMLNLLQQTRAGFTKSASHRMDAELCIINLCQPYLALDAQALSARLNRVEEQLRSGSFQIRPAEQTEEKSQLSPESVGTSPEPEEIVPDLPADEAPVGFWTDTAAAIRGELRPPLSGFFTSSPNAPVQGILQGNRLLLMCANSFTLEMIKKPEILELAGRKASNRLGKPITAIAVTQGTSKNAQMEQLLEFGRNHSDIVTIKDKD